MDDELMNTLRYLRLRGLLAHWDEYLTLARKQHFSAVRLLRYVVEEESKIRQEHARQLRLARARIPELWRMETFPFERQPKLDKKRILSLYDAFDYMTQNRNCIWVGPTGCGKTGLATGFLTLAAPAPFDTTAAGPKPAFRGAALPGPGPCDHALDDGLAHGIRKTLCRSSRQCGFPPAGKRKCTCGRRTARHRTATLARHGARLAKGSRLLLRSG